MASDIDKLIKEAAARGYGLRVTEKGTLAVKMPAKHDKGFEARLAANRDRVVMAMNPDAVSDRRSNAHGLSLITNMVQGANDLLNKGIDKAATDLPMGLSSVGKVAQALIPRSATGKLIAGATLPVAGIGEGMGL